MGPRTEFAFLESYSRLVKSPEVYVRDSGVAHDVPGPATKVDVLGHPVVGLSWEGFVTENLLSVAPERSEASFYRASGGAEIDLELTLPGRRPWAIETKRSLDPKPTKGFHSARKDVQPEACFVVSPGVERNAISKDVEMVSPADLAGEIAA